MYMQHAWTWSGALTEPVFTHEFLADFRSVILPVSSWSGPSPSDQIMFMLYCCLFFLKERDSLQSKVEELEEMLEAEKERQQKKTEEISSDEDAELAKHMAEESLMMHIEALQEENETLRY